MPGPRNAAAWLGAAVALLAGLAGLKLGLELHRLVLDPGPAGAVDLKLRHQEVGGWFAGLPVYDLYPNAVYPPASQLLLWPLLGWLSVAAARWLWAGLCLLALAWFVRLAVRESAAAGRGRWLAALMPLAINAAGVAIGNGQLSVLLLPPLAAAALRSRRQEGSWRADLLIAGLFLAALVKPTFSAPFFWLVLLVPGRRRPALLVVAGYLALTWAGAAFQEGGIARLLEGWIRRARADCVPHAAADLHALLGAAGLDAWVVPASLAVLALHGAWVYRHRRADIWILLGVTGLVARLWAYHRIYDDVLAVFGLIALLREAGRDGRARAPLLAALAVLLLPARLHEAWPPPWPALAAAARAGTWLWMLFALLGRAGAGKGREGGLIGAPGR